MKYLKIAVLLCIFAVTAFGQIVLSNNDIVEMVKNGLSEGIIIAKIKASETSFDISTPALKSLSDAKVPESIVIVMLEKEQKRKEQSSTNQQKSDDTINSIPEQGTLADIVGLKRVYISTDDLKSRDLIVKELNDNKQFEVVDTLEKSDFVIIYAVREEELGATGGVYGNTATVRKLTQLVGVLKVVMPSKEGSRLRNIFSTQKEKYYVWTDNPAKSTTKEFLKQLKKATKK
jgi:hypothetical protein